MPLNDETLKVLLDILPGDTSRLRSAADAVLSHFEERGRRAGRTFTDSLARGMTDVIGRPLKQAAAWLQPANLVSSAGEAMGKEYSQTYGAHNLAAGMSAASETAKQRNHYEDLWAKLGASSAPEASHVFPEVIGVPDVEKATAGDLLGQKFDKSHKADLAARAIGGQKVLGQAGEMAGEAIGTAVGGPIGGKIGAAIGRKLGEELPKQIAAPIKGVTDGLKTLGTALHGLQGPLGPIGAGFDLLGEGMEKVGGKIKSIPVVGELLGPMIDEFVKLPGLVKDITQTLTSFAAKASPGTFRLLEMAVDDVQGVIGQRFVPVVEMMRDAIRTVGDVLQTILPSASQMRWALEPIRSALADFASDIKHIAADLGPMLRGSVIVGLYLVSAGLKVLLLPLNGLAVVLRGLAKVAGMVFGSDKKKAQSSVGAAARPAQFSSFDEYQRQLQQRAFEMGGGKSTPENVKSILTVLTEMFNWFKSGFWEKLPSAIASAAEAAKNAVQDRIGQAVNQAASGSGGNPAQRLGRQIARAMGGGQGSIIGSMLGGGR